MSNNKAKRTVVHCSPTKLSELRAHVAHAQANGENERTLKSSVEEGMDLLIAKLAKKYGSPKKNRTKLRPGRRLSTE